MESSLGPALANIILTEFEKEVVSELTKSGIIKFYRRYVDDTLPLALVKPCDISSVLSKFNNFDKNLKFTDDSFPDGNIYFLDLKISDDDIDVYRKDTHTGQYTHYSSFEPFGRKVTWINSLFYCLSKIWSSSLLLNRPIHLLRSFMSWNVFPAKVRNLLIKKFKAKHFGNSTSSNKPFDDNDPKIWLRLPYLGKQGEFLVRNLIKKLRRNLKVKVNFVVIYQTKKTAFFASNKDKIPDLSRNNIIYEITCPGCNNKYIGKTKRCLQTRLSEHFYNINTCAVTHLNCPHPHYLANLNSL